MRRRYANIVTHALINIGPYCDPDCCFYRSNGAAPPRPLRPVLFTNGSFDRNRFPGIYVYVYVHAPTITHRRERLNAHRPRTTAVKSISAYIERALSPHSHIIIARASERARARQAHVAARFYGSESCKYAYERIHEGSLSRTREKRSTKAPIYRRRNSIGVCMRALTMAHRRNKAARKSLNNNLPSAHEDRVLPL